jgi:triosephosphate isomerase
MKNKLVIGNWKMHGDVKLLDEFIKEFEGTDVILGLPSIFILYARQKGERLKIASQDCSIFNGFGKHTGEVSCQMLYDAGVRHVIIGHSERVSSKLDSIDSVFKKISNATESGMTAVFCVDESYGSFIDERTASLINEMRENIVIAYEPISAIGTGNPQSVSDISRNILNIKEAYKGVAVIYGGSVTSQNAAEILSCSEVDGVLVGGSSLSISEMKSISGVVR